MYEYVKPSIAAYQSRKKFHTNQREQYESTDGWFNRVCESLNGCDYGEFADFLFIDKFVAGLDYELFENWCKPTDKLTINDIKTVFLTGQNDAIAEITCKNSIDTAPNIELTPDIDNYFTVNEIKLEDDDTNSTSEPENQLEQRHQIPPNNPAEMLNDNQRNFKTENFSKIDESIEKPTTNLKRHYGDIIENNIKGFKRDKNRIIICLDCGKRFKHKNSYNYHKRLHTGKNLYYCNVCGKAFVKENNLKIHLPSHESDNKFLECYLCSSKFDRIHGLRIHFTITHTTRTERSHQCSMCNRAFSKRRDFELHMKVHRGLVEGHKCEHCHRIFDKLATLKEHLVVHMKTKEFVCETCGRAFKTKSLLKKHMQSHNQNRQFKCCQCDQVLKSTTTLRNHMRQHTGERPYNCELCGKTFVTQPSLIKHLRVHRQEKPHACTICPKRFATNYHLKVHMTVHTGAKPYACGQCDRAFTQLGTLKAHQLKAHADEYAT